MINVWTVARIPEARAWERDADVDGDDLSAGSITWATDVIVPERERLIELNEKLSHIERVINPLENDWAMRLTPAGVDFAKRQSRRRWREACRLAGVIDSPSVMSHMRGGDDEC